MVQAKVETKTPAKKEVSVAVKKAAAVKKPAALKAKVAAAPVKKAGVVKSVVATTDKKVAKTTKGDGESRKKINLTPEQRYCMIAEAAYFRAEKRGFIGGDTAHDWTAAEAEIKQLIGQ